MSSPPADPRRPVIGHPRFPALEVRSLVGRVLLLPDDLPAVATLVVCAFRQRHQPLVDAWISWAVEDAGVAPSPLGLEPGARAAVVEVPVLGRRFRPFRGFIDGGMATGIGDPVVLARTLTVYTDVSSFCHAAGISGTDTVAAMVVRRDGSVLAHVSGPPDPAACAAVGAALGAAGHGPATG